ncbi:MULTISPECIES: NDP-hexose 2,3-dehydratase family protein [Streptomyces]|uniref:NDP-hexose 2,3-dehydratase n=1 Tax=Streptomyces dengpaensis TaxID=2049881 RepID=A0ABM6SMY9_9ACTN|nr:MULTISPECIES: NDP-hexose 2,3-dehydratase family protein [Streptomyces]AVH55998.1 NDP-hexose 2,3-dehydratase [Streptomyces dengpaensis]PIB12248.1 NDP-hexose 2,3-dehydratase [Streptomyces sp. HG99]
MLSHTLQPRAGTDLPGRLALSAATSRGARLATADFPGWLAARGRANAFRVDRVPFAELQGWSFEERTGNLVHRSGRFFTVEGLHVTERDGPYGDGPYADWYQPVIKQPEVGVLGILVKEFDGVLHFLMQAKMEPGNPNLLQLSPTVQATRSNYTKAHQGADVKYIEHFVGPGRGRVIADVLQSEHGSWFFRKSNRNMIVEASGDVPLLDDFCWLTLSQIGELLHQDNVINMDSRTVLSCLPLPQTASGALLSDVELLSWITGERSRHDVHAERVPLAGLPGWRRDEMAVAHEEGRYFKVVAVSVQAGNREVTSWTQPLFEPVGRGVTAFLTRAFDGVPHVLVHARVEGGFLDTVELGPTVQYTPGNYAHLPEKERPLFLDTVLDAPAERVRYEAVHAEEGGRFLHAESRYLLVDADERDAPLDPPPGYAWVTPDQLTWLVRHGHYLNVQARTLLACLNALPGRTP